jgi:ribosomal protein L12E/L44/L45/RPP1/RPP2
MMLRPAAIVFALVIADLATAQQAVILVRHAEKETDPAKLKGVADRDVPLNEAGIERAKALAEHLKDAKIDAVYTSFAKRTQETAAPLAKAAEKRPVVIGRDSIAKLGERNKDDVVLIVAHSGGALGVPQMIDQITGRKNGIKIEEAEFDRMFVLILRKDGSWSVISSKYGHGR